MSTEPQVATIQGGTYQDDLHLYRDDKGREIPSVTQMLDSCGLVDYENVPGATLEKKRQIGDAVHFATRLYDQDDLDPFSIHEEAVSFVESYIDLVDEVGLECEAEWIERPFIHTVHGMTYAGTIDRVCRFKKSGIKHRIVLELKCAYGEEASWKVQMAGYELAVPKTNGEYIARIACQLRPKDKNGKKQKARLFLYENPRDKDIFLQTLSLTSWKINEGMKWRKEQ